jgi:outer membrane protein TolC
VIRTVLAIVFLAAAFQFAQQKQPETGGAVELDLQKAVDLALEYNHDLRIAQIEKYIADQQLREAWGSAIFPEIQGTANYRRAIKRGKFFIETPFFSGTFPSGTENTMSPGVTLEQTLFSGSAFIAVSAAEIFVEMTDKQYEASRDQIIQQVRQSYYALLFSHEVVKLAKITLENARQNYEDTKALFDAGLVSEYDRVRASVQVQNLIPQLQEAENSREISENTLKLLTGLDLDTEIYVSDKLEYRRENLGDSDAYIDRLYRTSPLLKQLELQTELYDKNVSAAFSNHLPSLSATGSWSVESQENDPRSFWDWRYFNSVYVGLNLRIPIFNGFQTSARVEQAELDKKISEETLRKTRRELSHKVKETLLNLKNFEEKIEAYRLSIEEFELAYDLTLKRYKAGLGTQLELIDAMVGVSSAKVNYYQEIFNYLAASAELDRLLGEEIYESK